MRVGRILLVCLLVGGVFAAGYWARVTVLDQPDRVTAIEDVAEPSDTAEPEESPQAETARDTAEPTTGDAATQSGEGVQTEVVTDSAQTDSAESGGTGGESVTADRPDGADETSGAEDADSAGSSDRGDEGDTGDPALRQADDGTVADPAADNAATSAGENAPTSTGEAAATADGQPAASSGAAEADVASAPGDPAARPEQAEPGTGGRSAERTATAAAVDAAERRETPVAHAETAESDGSGTGDSASDRETAEAGSATATAGPESDGRAGSDPQDDASRDADRVADGPNAPPETATASRTDRAGTPGKKGPSGDGPGGRGGGDTDGAAGGKETARDPDRDAPTGRPAFDVVRVEPGGSAVIAGRAAPNISVTVLEDGDPIGAADTNAAGEFVVLPGKKLSVGRSELTLKSTGPSGEIKRSADAVVIATPPGERGKSRAGGDKGDDGGDRDSGAGAATKPFALKVPREGSGGAEVMQQPQGRPTPEGSDEANLAFRVVQYTNTGGLVVSGTASEAWRVRVKLDGRRLGATRADPGSGQWSIIYRDDISAGLYTLKARALDAGGDVVARARTPFASQPNVRGLDDERLVVVQPGSNLWTIARRTYGEGVQYTTIYNANQDQIADPDLIYPGQVFVLPEGSRADGR